MSRRTLRSELPLRRTRRQVVRRWLAGALVAGMATSLSSLMIVNPARAEGVAPNLGSTAALSVLGGETVTNTGPSVLSRGLALSPGSSVTGLDEMTVGGDVNVANPVADQAQLDLTSAYNAAEAQPSDGTYPDGPDLTLDPGVYTSASSLDIDGQLTLDAGGDLTAVFIFQVGSELTAPIDSDILLVNGAQACNVFWQVGSSATLQTGVTFVGTVMALESITVNNSVTIDGRVLASNGSVTLDTDTFVDSGCDTGEGGGGSTGSSTSGTDTTGTDTSSTDTSSTDTSGTDTSSTPTTGSDTSGTGTTSAEGTGTGTSATTSHTSVPSTPISRSGSTGPPLAATGARDATFLMLCAGTLLVLGSICLGLARRRPPARHR